MDVILIVLAFVVFVLVQDAAKRKEQPMDRHPHDETCRREPATASRLRLEPPDTQPFAEAGDGWWDGLSALERVGVVALGVTGAAVTTAFLAPGLLTTAAGGALGGASAWLLRKGLKRA